jgi:CBS domain-containing protein
MSNPLLARDVMTPDPARCTIHATLDEVAGLMIGHDRGEILVVDAADRPVGIITDRDIVRRVVAKGKNPMAYAATMCMSRPVVTVRGAVSLDEVRSLMAHHQIRRIVVVDEAGCCAGIIAEAELVNRCASLSNMESADRVAQGRGKADLHRSGR